MKKSNYTITRFDIERDDFYVEIVPTTLDNDDFLEFWLCNDHHSVKELMFGCDAKHCPEDTWEQRIIDVIDTYIEQYDDFDIYYDVGSGIYEAIDIHNAQITEMQKLGDALTEQYSDIENTSVNDIFCDAMKNHIGMSIWLCCEANSCEKDHPWMTTEDWRVVKTEQNDDKEN